MKNNQIFSTKISPYKIWPKKKFFIVWAALKNKNDRWVKMLFSNNNFYSYGIEKTSKVVAWKLLLKNELQSNKSVKEIKEKEKAIISSLDDNK